MRKHPCDNDSEGHALYGRTVPRGALSHGRRFASLLIAIKIITFSGTHDIVKL